MYHAHVTRLCLYSKGQKIKKSCCVEHHSTNQPLFAHENDVTNSDLEEELVSVTEFNGLPEPVDTEHDQPQELITVDECNDFESLEDRDTNQMIKLPSAILTAMSKVVAIASEHHMGDTKTCYNANKFSKSEMSLYLSLIRFQKMSQQ